MTDWASGVVAKIERAKEYIAEFGTDGQAFLKSHPYSAVGQLDPQSGEVSFVVRTSHVIPPRLAVIAADALRNLRIPLDIIWHQVWSKGAGGYGKLYFPFVETADELEARFKTVKQPPHKAAVNILRTAKAYKSGHKFLRALHKGDAKDKHEVPLLAAATYQKCIIHLPRDLAWPGGKGPTEIESVIVPSSGFLFLEDGTELPLAIHLDTEAGPVVDMKCDLTADIAFGQGEILEGEPVLKTLHEASQFVDRLVDAFRTAKLMD
jgi:hypothetical protein